MPDLEAYRRYFKENQETIFQNYFHFLRFASIATDPAHKKDVLSCAEWLSHYLTEAGLQVEKWETENSPVLFATDLSAGPHKKTLLLYCHYDVQPVDPLDEWTTPPFEPDLREGEVYARGASDNKGQCFYTISAIKALLSLRGSLPVNLKFIIEGEEESGSLNLAKILEEKKEALKADYLLIVDSGIEKADAPAITLGARGLVCMQVTLQEANFDLHSGSNGGIAYNPNRALAELIAKLHDSEGRVAIPHFYDSVKEISSAEKKAIAFDFETERFQSMFGFKPTGMEKGVSPYEATWLRPTIEVNGMWGGYTGAGFKTVIPAKAFAKISCRLVPDQSPEEIGKLVADFLIKNTPGNIKTTVEILPGNGKGFRTDAQTPFTEQLSQAYSLVFNKECKKILIGGSIPIAVQLREAAHAEMLLIGVALPDDHIHAPNEHFGKDRFEKGFLTICQAIELFP